MAHLGITNLSAYLRKMAVDGLIVNQDIPELGEIASPLLRSSNNLNQLTRRVHETGRIYEIDLKDVQQGYEKLWEALSQVLTSLAALG